MTSMHPATNIHPFPTYNVMEEGIITIYDDSGLPTAVLYGEHASHDALQMISDEALDELFPLSSQDAAELDALDDFVTTMMYLSFLEDCEEEARLTKGCDPVKRPTKVPHNSSTAVMNINETIRCPTTRNDIIRLLQLRGDVARVEYGYLHFHGSKESLDSYLRVMERAQHHKVGNRVHNRTKIPHYNIQQPRRHCT